MASSTSKPIIAKIFCRVAIINHKGQLLVIRRSQDAIERPLEWELVGDEWEADHKDFEHTIIDAVEEITGLKLHDLKTVKATPEPQHNGTYNLHIALAAKVGDATIQLNKFYDLYTWIEEADLTVYNLPITWHAAARLVMRNQAKLFA